MKLPERTFEPQFSLLLRRWREKVMTSGLLGLHNKETHGSGIFFMNSILFYFIYLFKDL